MCANLTPEEIYTYNAEVEAAGEDPRNQIQEAGAHHPECQCELCEYGLDDPYDLWLLLHYPEEY